MREEHARASQRLEEACDFTGAAREALLAGDPRRAARLAPLTSDEALINEALDRVVADLPRELALSTAGDLFARGFGAPAGALYARLGAHAEAGEAFSAAGKACLAAQSFELAGRPADGARALEAALRMRPDDAAARLALGRLLARHGRTEAAVRTLQQLASDAPERREALPLLKRCLSALGLDEAARTLDAEMAALGVRDEGPEPEAGAALPSEGRGPLVLGRYETVREVAVTPHARVIEAIDRVSGERVAVKLFAATAPGGRDALLRFEREARALAQLRHRNVVPMRAYHPEAPAIVLDWMSGGSLADRLREGVEIAPARSVEITCAVLTALGEAHRLGILHRDIKPSNVLFDDAGAVYLTDFGAAHLGDLSSTATAGVIGTFAYMSPEQRRGQPATIASDLYSAGVLLAEMLVGEPPAPSSGVLSLQPSACHPDLGEAHDAILARLVRQDPAERPADAFDTKRLLLSLRWPERVVGRERRVSLRSPSERPLGSQDERLGPSLDPGDGRDLEHRRHDAWIDRDVLVLPLDDESLALARAFARAGHPSLPAVLRIDPQGGAIWIAPPRGLALADAPRGISPGQIARLAEAIESLHAASGAHGFIDPEHMYWHDGEISLAYPRAHLPLAEAQERDRLALERLRGA